MFVCLFVVIVLANWPFPFVKMAKMPPLSGKFTEAATKWTLTNIHHYQHHYEHNYHLL